MDIANKSKRELRFALERGDERNCWIKSPIITEVLVCGDVSDVEVANT